MRVVKWAFRTLAVALVVLGFAPRALAYTGTPVDLELVEKVRTDPFEGPAQGTRVRYRVTVRNNGAYLANAGATIVDVMPTGLTDIQIDAEQNGVDCSVNGQQVTCVLPDLPVGASRTVIYSATVSALAGTRISNTATAKLNTKKNVERNASNNSKTHTFTVV